MSQLTQRVPVGFRFHPTDEELVGYYLPKKVSARKIDLDLIRDLDLYKLEPWDLQDLCKIQADANDKQTDYYFFSRKDRKYPTGNRANRATTKGFWKATGRDKPIHTKLQTLIGMRKTLVFYQGRAPHGAKTDWIMHEFRLDDGPGRPAHEDGGWVVCRVFKKNKNLKMKLQERATSFEESQRGLMIGEPVGSPEIFSSRFAAQFGAGVKQEIINLDEYQVGGSGGHQQFVTNSYGLPKTSTSQYNFQSGSHGSHHSLPLMSFRSRLDDDGFLSVPESSPVFGHDAGETSSGTSEGGTADPDDQCAGILGLPEMSYADWSAALYQDQAKVITSNQADQNSVLLHHLKRQNSDIFSSMDLWTYSQVAQHM